jgi:hypothetical protein
MSTQRLLATFDHPDDAIAACEVVRQNGCKIVDVYAPYAVHGLDYAMGVRRSRLTWVCFICGMIGALGMFWFQHWTAAVDWPIDVGGKPWNSLPSDVPVAFETMVLLAGFGTVFAFLAVSRLYPGKHASLVTREATDDQFALVVEPTDATLDLPRFRSILKDSNAQTIQLCPDSKEAQ